MPGSRFWRTCHHEGGHHQARRGPQRASHSLPLAGVNGARPGGSPEIFDLILDRSRAAPTKLSSPWERHVDDQAERANI